MRRLTFFSVTLGLALAATSQSAFADSGATPPPPPSGDKPASGTSTDTKASGSIKVDDAPIDTKKPDSSSPTDPNAPPKKQFGEGDSPLDDLDKDKDNTKKDNGTVWFLGARFRDFIVPHFMFSIFASGGPQNVNIFSGGPEATMRTGNFEMDMSFTVPYADYSMNGFLFKNKNEPVEAFELVQSSLKLFTFSLDLLGNIPLDKARRFSILLGGGVGLSGVSGSLWRNQVYPKNPAKVDTAGNDPSQWVKCARPDDPNGVVNGTQFCDSSNNHYGTTDPKKANQADGYSEASWVNGGSLPVVFPYLALPHIAFRVEPIKYLQMRLDTGFAFTGGFFVGFAAGGRLPI